jgi:hypothetical protein
MAFAYTKTLAIVAAGQMALRLPLTYLVDPYPFASFGVFWAGVSAAIMLLILGPVFDCGSWLAWRAREWRRVL